MLDELLRLPLAQAALSRSAGTADSDGLLDGFLVLADAFGTFLAEIGRASCRERVSPYV